MRDVTFFFLKDWQGGVTGVQNRFLFRISNRKKTLFQKSCPGTTIYIHGWPDPIICKEIDKRLWKICDKFIYNWNEEVKLAVCYFWRFLIARGSSGGKQLMSKLRVRSISWRGSFISVQHSVSRRWRRAIFRASLLHNGPRISTRSTRRFSSA